MSLNIETGVKFANLEEVGVRLKMIRESKKMNISTVSAASGLGWLSIESIEKGAGTAASLERIAKTLGVEIDIRFKNKAKNDTRIILADLQPLVTEIRNHLGLTRNKLSTLASVTATSVSVFETAESPTINMTAKLLRGLGCKLSIRLLVDGKQFVVEDDNITKKNSSAVHADSTDFYTHRIAADLSTIRESLDLTKAEVARRTGVSASMIVSVEKHARGAASFSKIAEALGYHLSLFIRDGNRIIDCNLQNMPEVLDSIREERGLKILEFAREMGATYRTVKIFPESTSSPARVIERYARHLDVQIGHTLEKM